MTTARRDARLATAEATSHKRAAEAYAGFALAAMAENVATTQKLEFRTALCAAASATMEVAASAAAAGTGGARGGWGAVARTLEAPIEAMGVLEYLAGVGGGSDAHAPRRDDEEDDVFGGGRLYAAVRKLVDALKAAAGAVAAADADAEATASSYEYFASAVRSTTADAHASRTPGGGGSVGVRSDVFGGGGGVGGVGGGVGVGDGYRHYEGVGGGGGASPAMMRLGAIEASLAARRMTFSAVSSSPRT